jgi:phosphoglycerate dehydrogenase-like enzyme
MVGCPLDETTRDMIGEEELQLMKPTASLINVARGGVVNEKALVQALKDGTIASAIH